MNRLTISQFSHTSSEVSVTQWFDLCNNAAQIHKKTLQKLLFFAILLFYSGFIDRMKQNEYN